MTNHQMRIVKRASLRSRGFSLVEGLIAIAIIMIVLGMAIMNTSSLLPIFKANSGMDQVLSQLRSARAKAIAHRIEIQVEFVGTNQMRMTEIWNIGTAPAPVTVTYEGGAQYLVFSAIPQDTPMAFGNGSAVFFGGLSGGPPIMKFTTNGSFIDGGNTLVNGTVFLGLPGQPSTARAITILGATGRVRQYHWDGAHWQE
jgi:type II secretory pathway pseudopilin PulG